MCITVAPAWLSETIVLLYKKNHPVHGEIAVAGYQNCVQNKHSGPNAMTIHVPTHTPMTAENIIDTSACKNVLKDMGDAANRFSNRGMRGMCMSKSIVSFAYDVYHVVIANDTSNFDAIEAALSEVPESKRPSITRELLAFYDKQFKGWPLMFFCFNNADAQEAAPVMYWFNHLDSTHFSGYNVLYGPGLDSHDGGVPNLEKEVERDHWIIVGTDNPNGEEVEYKDEIPEGVREYLPKYVVGKKYGRYSCCSNQDFAAAEDAWLNATADPIQVALYSPGTVSA